MAGPSSSSSPSPHTKPPKSKSIFTTYFFSKSFIIIFALLVFTFFPSQAPEPFKHNTILVKLWELIYLLVIGIAVCYGLFSRKTDTFHTYESYDDGCDDNVKESYLSGISHISSIFEDGVHNNYGFDEKDNSLFVGCKGLDSRVSRVGEFKGLGSRFSENGDFDGKKANTGFVRESLVVINDEKYVLEQLGRQNKRNLGSKSLDSAAGKSVVEDIDSDSDSLSGWDGNKKGKFRGLVPIKLEKKFKEIDSDSDSEGRMKLNWRSKSMRLEKREDMVSGTSHVRPVADGAFDVEGLKAQSRSFRMPSKNKNLSEKGGMKGVEPNHRYRKPYLNGETSFVEPNHSFTVMNDRSNVTEIVKDFSGTLDGRVEESLKDFGKIKVDDGTLDAKNSSLFINSKSQSSSTNLQSTQKPATIVNNYKRGKSVRTNRSKEQVVESKVEMFQSRTDDLVDSRSKQGTYEKNVRGDELSDTEPHSGEVDRKAEEFIAKFKEQIRLQKVASARKLNLL